MRSQRSGSFEAPKLLAALTLPVMFLHVIFPGAFGDVGLFSLFVPLFYLLFFSISFYLSLFVFHIALPRWRLSFSYLSITSWTRRLFFLAFSIYISSYVLFVGIDYSSFIELRNGLINFYRSSDVVPEFKMLNSLGLFVFFYASYLYMVDDRHRVLYALGALSFPLLMANRNFVLVFAIFAIYNLAFVERRSLMTFLVLIFFFVVNIFYVYVFDKGDQDLNILFATVKSLAQYAALPLHGLSYSIDVGIDYGDFLTLPASIVNSLGYRVDREYVYTPYPFQTNVYTLFFGVLYDFGVFGVAVFAVALGAFHAFLFVMAKTSEAFLFVYLYSIYPLLMTLFDNVYTSSLGIWLYLSIPFFFFGRTSLRKC